MNKSLDDLTEKQVLQLIATDRLDIPVSSMSGKLKRAKPKIASTVSIEAYGGNFSGTRVYARLEEVDKQKARGMSAGIAEFKERYPAYGEKLQTLIDEERTSRERHLYFGMNEGRRITTTDYLSVMESLGFSPAVAETMYEALIDASRKISKARTDEERSVLIDSTLA